MRNYIKLPERTFRLRQDVLVPAGTVFTRAPLERGWYDRLEGVVALGPDATAYLNVPLRVAEVDATEWLEEVTDAKKLGIAEIRHCLHVLADLEVAAGRGAQGALLHYLAEATRRRRAVHRAPAQRAPRPSRRAVDAYIRTHPGADYMAIAMAFDTNTGRISEVLNPP